MGQTVILCGFREILGYTSATCLILARYVVLMSKLVKINIGIQMYIVLVTA